MIKANELRVGNFVYWNLPTGKPEKVSAYDFESIEGGENVPLPIPLTPEILEQCGFDEWGNTGLLYKKLFSDFELRYVDPEIILDCDNCYKVTLRNIQYLHQLQNLYFAITGEELDIKELKSREER